jgi:chromosome partitioning protein
MTRTIAIVNEKGGVGKTTTIIELAFQLGNSGKSVLVVDLDSQENASKMLLGKSMSEIADEETKTIFDAFLDVKNKVQLDEIIKPAIEAWQNTLVLPSDCRLATISDHLHSRLNKEHILKGILSKIKDNFDYILIDLSPLMNVLTINALVAADYYLVPTDLSVYSQKGMRTIHEVAEMIKSSGNNPDLQLLGVFVTSFQKGGSNAVRALLDELEEEYKDKFLTVKVPDSVKVIESQRQKTPVGLFAPDSNVAVAYRELSTIIQGEAP